eukprot:XP_024453195.1 uncharacterized protein LOC7461329 isoform X2 [Populus trichocarpa]
MFRRFMVTRQKLLLNEEAIKKKRNEDDCVCLSASGNATQSVTQKSVTSELEVESFCEDQRSEVLAQTKQTKPQPLTEMPVNLHCLASNAFFMRRECLNTVKQSCSRFGNLSYQSTSNLELRKFFCRSIGVRFSYPDCIRSQPSVEVDGKAGRGNFGPPAPYIANPINFTGVKRQNDQSADSGFSFKLQKPTPRCPICKADAYHQKRKSEHRVHISDTLIPGPAFLDSICNTQPLLSSTGGDAHLQSRTRFETGAEIQDRHSMHLVQNMPHVYLAKDASYCSNILELSMFQESKDNVDALNDNGTCLPDAEMQEPGGITSILKDCEALKPVEYDAVEKIAEGILSEDKMDDCKLVLKLSTTEPVINCLVETSDLSFKPQVAQQSVLDAFANSKTYSDNDKYMNANAATSNCLPYESNTDQIQMKPTNSDDAISFGTSRRMSIIQSFGDSLMNNKECYLPCTFDPLVKPQLTERLAIGTFSSSIIYSENDKIGNARAATSNCFPCKLNIDQSQLEHGDNDDATSVETSLGASMISPFEGSSMDDKGHCRPGTSDLSFKPQMAQQSAVGAFDNIKTRSGNEKIGNCLSSELNTHKVLIQPCNSDNATSVETSRRVSMISSSEGSSMNNERNIPGTSDQPFKSKVSQQPAESTFTYSNSLHMKFPKDFNLPSKMDLIRKFSRFGRVDPLKTKVFQVMGSAQVVFFEELDAVAAYQYAKRKNNLYGVATVLYWLDRSGQKRRGPNFLSPSSSSNLKSSLKKSGRRGKEDNKRTRKVRFTIET